MEAAGEIIIGCLVSVLEIHLRKTQVRLNQKSSISEDNKMVDLHSSMWYITFFSILVSKWLLMAHYSDNCTLFKRHVAALTFYL